MTHIALIPDGNRRYMKKQSTLSLRKTYAKGITHFKEFLEWCLDFGITEVTLYALSLENIKKRGKSEINLLLTLFSTYISKYSQELIKKNIKLNICGDREVLKKLNKKVYYKLKEIENKTSNNKKFILNLAIAYGAIQEILQATEKIFNLGLKPTEVNFRKYLWVNSYPDLIIRTAETRLSNFLLFQGAYSEIYFVPKLWQEFEKEDLKFILNDFRIKDRRFGK